MPALELAKSFNNASDSTYEVAWSADGAMLAASSNGQANIWPETGGDPIVTIDRDASAGLAWNPMRPELMIGTKKGYLYKWSDGVARKFNSPPIGDSVTRIAWSSDGSRLAIADNSGYLHIWKVEPSGDCIILARARVRRVNRLFWWPTSNHMVGTFGANGVLARTDDRYQRDPEPIALGHMIAGDLDVSRDGFTAIGVQGSSANVIAVIDQNGVTTALIEGIPNFPDYLRFSPDGQFLAVVIGLEFQVWRRRDWTQVAAVKCDSRPGFLAFHPSGRLLAVAVPGKRKIDCYRLDDDLLNAEYRPDSRRYVNAKVVLLGDTGVGKSALGLVLSGQPYAPTDSTHGRNVWMFDSREVEKPDMGTQTREVLLWDLAGQPGYRLVHQLHLNEVAAAVIVFDSRSETDPFSGVKHWMRALAQARRLEGAAAVPIRIYLVAARADRGGVAVTRERIQGMVEDFGLDAFFETSAREGWHVAELAAAIRDGIDWDSLPMVSSNALFQSIKEFLLAEKGQGRLLSTAADLFLAFRSTHPDVADEPDLRASFDACIGRVESRGLITRLHFGDLVLLQPELLDAYASAMVQAAKEEPDGLGFLPEEEALQGRFRLSPSERVPDREQEKLLLIATVEELLRHEIALKETTDRGVDLIFPSQFTREQAEAPNIAGKQLVLAFEGPLRSIYATLAVRLSHSTLFRRQEMWQNAAAYTAADGGTCGIHLRELDEGCGEIAIFFDSRAGRVVRAQFETYVTAYIQSRALAGSVDRRRIRICPDIACGYVLPDDLVRMRLQLGKSTVFCPLCERAVVSLTDEEPATMVNAGATDNVAILGVAPDAASADSAATDRAVAEMNRSADLQRDQNVAALRLQGKIQTSDYDVFLCYHSKDRDHVAAIGERLKERGILPWLDVWEIPPGTRWQPELRKRIKQVKSAAVFLGPSGTGPWQEIEVQTILNDFIKRKRPVIPVILAGRQGKPRLPDFLNLWHAVDMRNPVPDPFEQLVWGVTGERPFDS